MKGSCFCGACEFELTGKIGPVGKCHCSKCRKVSGTGSNAVLWAAPEAVTWVKGEQESKQYTKASGWGTVFCQHCGSPLPAMNNEKTMWFVPAGLLDEDPGAGVMGHIWTSAKPSWDIIGDDAPQFEENA